MIQAVFILYWLLSYAFAATKYWTLSFVQPTNISQVASPAGLTSVTVLQRSSSYLLQLQLAEPSTGLACASCSDDYAAIGGQPVLDLYRENPALLAPEIHSEKTEFSTTLNAWYVPIKTRDSGSFILTVTGNSFGSLAFQAGHASATDFLLAVTWIPSTRASTTFNAQLFRQRFTPTLSGDWIATVPGVNTLVRSHDEWESFDYMTSSLADYSEKCGATSKEVYDAVAIGDGLFMATSVGIIYENSTGSSLVLSECIKKLFPSTQTPPFGRLDCSKTFFVSTDRVWYTHGNLSTVSSLVDASGNQLNEALTYSSIGIVSVAASIISCKPVSILIDTSTRFELATLNMEKNWYKQFIFPNNIPAFVNDPVIIYNNTIVSSNAAIWTTLSLTNMEFGHRTADDLFAWGNALLYSPDGGDIWFILNAFSNATITSFTTSSDGFFAFTTSAAQIWFGIANSKQIVQIPGTFAGTLSPTLAYHVFFDSLDNLYELVINTATGMTIQRTKIDVQEILDSYSFLQQNTCDFDELLINASMDPLLTRRTDIDDILTPLPPAIFLDLSDTYKFRIGLKRSSNLSAAELSLMFSLSSDGHVRFDTSKSIDYIHNIANFDITVKDRPEVEYFQELPGQNLHPSSLSIHVSDTGFACKDAYKKSSIKTSTVQTLQIYTGCKPGVDTKFAPPKLLLEDSYDDIPSTYFDRDLDLAFTMTDLVTGIESPYEGHYRLRLVGGGLTKDDITYFTADEVMKYNPTLSGNSIVWGPLDEVPVTSTGEFILGHGSNKIAWICSIGAPCNGILPKVSERSFAEYYFIFEMSTEGVVEGESYCLHSERFMLRLYGIPPSNLTMLAIWGITIIIGLAYMYALIAWLRRKEIQEEKRAAQEALLMNAEGAEDVMGVLAGGAAATTTTGLQPVWYDYTSYGQLGTDANGNIISSVTSLGNAAGNVGSIGSVGGVGSIGSIGGTRGIGSDYLAPPPMQQ